MPDDLLRIPFEFFVTVIWDRYGPVAGVFAAVVMLAIIVGLIVAAIRYGPAILASL